MKIEQEKENIAREIVSAIITTFKEGRWDENRYTLYVESLKNLQLHAVNEGRMIQAKDSDAFNQTERYYKDQQREFSV